MNKLSQYRKLRYNQLFESENRELRLNEMAILLKCCLSMLILRSFVLLLNQPFLPESAKVMPVQGLVSSALLWFE